ncbi:Kae1-associated kinase Bud32, partial [Methanocalculus sp.]|uniref:Kae1-associated kinase Bud32 n=1 Tax=Methanocalculus sp. TaxID=2004547 RepID=UPI0027234623
LKKGYRHPLLDSELIRDRTRAEARIISVARRAGVPTPVIRDVTKDQIRMEKVDGTVLKYALNERSSEEAGRVVGMLHTAGIVHGDLTTSNIIVRDAGCVLIDFGLAQITTEVEARGVDLHVFFQTLESTSPEAVTLRDSFIRGYSSTFSLADEVLRREHEIELRGRYL